MSSESGKASSVITLARVLARNAATTSTTNNAPSTSAVTVLSIAFWMKVACRNRLRWTNIPSGSAD